MKIQINSLEALERLIGNNTDVEIEIRNNIVQEFTKKHLKALVNDSLINKTVSEVNAELQKTINSKLEESIATISRNGYYNTVVTLKPEIIDKVKDFVRDTIDTEIQQAVDVAMKTWKMDSNIEDRVNKKFAYYTDEHVKQVVRQKLSDVASKLC